MNTVDKFYYPPIFINGYIKSIIETWAAKQLSGTDPTDITFFPTMPSNIDEMWETAQTNGSNQIIAIYDRLFRMRRSPFPRIKSEQLLYYMYAPSSGVAPLLKAVSKIQDFLDEEDYSAQEVNAWIKSQLNANGKYVVGSEEFDPVFFNRIRIYQLEEVRDVVDFATARAVFGNKIIIDYDWHAAHSSE